MNIKRPKVGLGVMIVKDKKVLIGKRKGAHGAGCYAFPGGHLEWFEEYSKCAEREVKEETGMSVIFDPIDALRPEVFTTNNRMVEDDTHYITIFVKTLWMSGEPITTEPWNTEGWFWVTLDELVQLNPPDLYRKENHPQQHWIPSRHILRWSKEIGI